MARKIEEMATEWTTVSVTLGVNDLKMVYESELRVCELHSVVNWVQEPTRRTIGECYPYCNVCK